MRLITIHTHLYLFHVQAYEAYYNLYPSLFSPVSSLRGLLQQFIPIFPCASFNTKRITTHHTNLSWLQA